MEEHKYKLAGWLAFASAVMIFPEMLMGILIDARVEKFGFLTLPWAAITLLEACFSVYVMFRFRHLLNNLFNFHKLDTLILLMVIGGIIMTVQFDS